MKKKCTQNKHLKLLQHKEMWWTKFGVDLLEPVSEKTGFLQTDDNKWKTTTDARALSVQ